MYTKIHRVAHQTDNNREFGGNLGWKVGWPKRILVFSVMFRFCLLLSRFSRVLLCDPIDGSPPGSSVPGILQARTLAWVAISFSIGFVWGRIYSCVRAGNLELEPCVFFESPHV